MLRSIGGTELTTEPPMTTSPDVASSSPAVMRSTVVFPEPDGPTTTMNSPSSISRSRSSTATVPPGNTFLSSWYSILATSLPPARPVRDQVAVPQGAPLRDAPLRLEVDEHDPEPLAVAGFPLEVVQQRPDVVAAHVDAGRTRPVDGLDVPADVRDAALVLHDRFAVEPVVERGAVLGDQQRHVAVVVADAHEQLRQRRRDDGPAHRRQLGVLVDLAQPEHSAAAALRDEVRPVEVDAEEVE